jgi:hypothetical protein
MQRRIAVKRLTASDLTLFEWHFRNANAGNQKSINLNADIFIEHMFPSLPEVAETKNWRIPIDLSVYGPGHAGLYNLQRKIMKGSAYKNWRLDGEYITDPHSEPDRFRVLAPGDFAVLDFAGSVVPDSLKMLLVARNLQVDRPVYDRLLSLMGDRKMIVLPLAQLQAIAEEVDDDEHPVHQLTLYGDLEDAAKGGARGRAALGRRPIARKVGRDELKRAREAGEQVGRTGEELVFAHLIGLKANRKIEDVTWVADVNAVAPYDFLVILTDGREVALDVKSTTGEFDRPIHISSNELAEMSTRRYDLYRVFEITENAAKLRVAEDVGDFAPPIREQFSSLPEGVEVDSISVEPRKLQFGGTINLRMPDEEEFESET